ncbi:MAG: cysteine desulfurase family protein [bacterium]|nr:cysteine desulfurase family protein [bacterium]
MIYLDNAATTKPSEAAVKAMCKAAEYFGNPSSLYGPGLDAEKLINESKAGIASKLGIEPKCVYFTSGGTEANNTAVFGTAYSRIKMGKRLITTSVEHPSVLEAFKKLETEGFDVVYLGVDGNGRILLDELEAALTEDTVLVSVMHVNNETGVIEPVDKIKAVMKKKSPKALLHCDCVQSFGKLPVLPRKWGADLITISAHKIHGFKGCGALCVMNGRLKPLIYGGEQQNSFRPGTENVGGILAFGAAAKECQCDNSYLIELRNEMKTLLGEKIDNIKFNGSDEYSAGSVLNVSFIGIKAEILLHAMETHGVYVSTGSACSSHKPQPSHVLTAMGLNSKEIEGAVRISFDESITKAQLKEAADFFETEVKQIRRYMR